MDQTFLSKTTKKMKAKFKHRRVNHGDLKSLLYLNRSASFPKKLSLYKGFFRFRLKKISKKNYKPALRFVRRYKWRKIRTLKRLKRLLRKRNIFMKRLHTLKSKKFSISKIKNITKKLNQCLKIGFFLYFHIHFTEKKRFRLQRSKRRLTQRQWYKQKYKKPKIFWGNKRYFIAQFYRHLKNYPFYRKKKSLTRWIYLYKMLNTKLVNKETINQSKLSLIAKLIKRAPKKRWHIRYNNIKNFKIKPRRILRKIRRLFIKQEKKKLKLRAAKIVRTRSLVTFFERTTHWKRDIFFNSFWFTKIINKFIKRGRKHFAENLILDVFSRLKEREKVDSYLTFWKLLVKIKPIATTVPKRVGKIYFSIPIPITLQRGYRIGLKWLINSIELRTNELTLKTRVYNEIAALLENQRTNTIKQRDTLYRVIDENKTESHYRWI